jgi:uncharacterized membrane protein YraQ (UPF0718 family)
VVFAMGVVHSFISPERTRAWLAGKPLGVGNVMAASLGIVTPFCSCSAVPLFIGFLSAGVPLGVTFSFLISAPMVNEVALALLFGLFGWKVAALYLGLGLTVAIVAGLVIGKLGMITTWRTGCGPSASARRRTWATVRPPGRTASRPASPMSGRSWAGSGPGSSPASPWAPASTATCPRISWPASWARSSGGACRRRVLLGVPMYSNAAGILPIIEALLGKGAALGTALAFMMSVIALSLPEMIILRKVLKPTADRRVRRRGGLRHHAGGLRLQRCPVR